jgi:hypothetical protein
MCTLENNIVIKFKVVVIKGGNLIHIVSESYQL